MPFKVSDVECVQNFQLDTSSKELKVNYYNITRVKSQQQFGNI